MSEKCYGMEDFVKGRVDDETLDRIAKRADELQRLNLTEEEERVSDEEFEAEMNRQMDELGIPEPQNILISPEQAKRLNLTDKDKAIADKTAKLIARDYGEVLRRLENE